MPLISTGGACTAAEMHLKGERLTNNAPPPSKNPSMSYQHSGYGTNPNGSVTERKHQVVQIKGKQDE